MTVLCPFSSPFRSCITNGILDGIQRILDISVQIDEHYYNSIEWACEQHYRFDNYKRGVADLFIGELGINGKYPYNLLATGAIRMSIERNGDLNPLFAERLVMRHWDFLEHRIFLPIWQLVQVG